MVCLILLACLGGAPAFAKEEGTLKAKLIAVLKANAGGECPASLMVPMLRDACEQQMTVMKKQLKKLGAIQRPQYKGNEKLPNGIETEVYRVYFENGSMLWIVAAGTDEKLAVMWSPGVAP
jgi:hypothetical protein